MKVVKLGLEGFTCYRQKTEVDFSDLDLFAITGATGSGKSSLVEAIIFALYGKTPRMGNDLTNLVSQGLKSMNVVLEFTSGPGSYRVTRYMQVGRGGQAILEMKEENGWRHVCSRVRQVNPKILKILGVDYDTFTRCIVLPQGEFAQFLDDAKNRQEILIKLLGLEILGEMQKKASKSYEQTREEIQHIEQRLKDEFAGVSAEQLQRLNAELANMESEILWEQKRIEEMCETQREWSEAIRLGKILKDLEGRYERLQPRMEELKKLQRKIEIARRILPLLPHLEQFKMAQNRLMQVFNREKSLEEQGEALTKAQEEAKEDLDSAMEDYRRLGDLENEERRLQELQHLVRQLHLQEEKLSEEREGYERERQRFQELQKSLDEMRSALQKFLGEKESCESKMEDLEVQKKVFQKFHGAENLIPLLKETRENHLKSSEKWKLSSHILEQRKKQFQKSVQEFYEQERVVKDLQQKLNRAEIKQDLERELFKLEEAHHLQERMKEQENECQQVQIRLAHDRKTHEEIAGQIAMAREGVCAMDVRLRETLEEHRNKETTHNEAQAIFQPCREMKERAEILRESCEKLDKKRQEEILAGREFTEKIRNWKEQRDALRREVEVAKEQWMSAYTHDLAYSLRQHLKAGEKCPVCRQTVKKIPEEDRAGEFSVKELQAQMEQKLAQMESADQKLAEYETMLAASCEALKETENEMRQREEELQKLKEQLGPSESRLSHLLESENYETTLEKLREHLRQLSQEIQHLEHLISEKQSYIREQEFSLSTLANLKKEREKEIERHQKGVTELKERIESLVGKINIAHQKEEVRRKLEGVAGIEKNLAKAEKSFLNLVWQKDAAEQQLKDAEKTVENDRKQAEETLQAWKQKQDIVREQMGLEVENIAQAIEDGIREYRQISQKLEKHIKDRERLLGDLKRQEISVAARESALKEIAQSLSAKESKIAELKEKNTRMELAIHKATKGENVTLLIERLKHKKADIETHYQKAREQSLILEQQAKAYKQEKRMVEQSRAELEEEIRILGQKFEHSLREIGVESVEQILDMKINPENLREWEKEAIEDEMRIQELKVRIQDCREQLKGRTVSPEALEKLESQLQQARASLNARLEGRGEIAHRIQQMKKMLDDAEEMQKASQQAGKVVGIYYQLSRDLRSDQFPSYVLEHSLGTLAEDGSAHLDLLSSGRYAFAMEKREFYVVDHWNEEKIRPARTLSGGETFLASLALALALADRIYQMGSHIGDSAALESLFIDEGFGSLDEEHLDLVVKALHNLQGAGRTIGVISHLTQLNNYLPVRLVVKKERSGSFVCREQT